MKEQAMKTKIIGNLEWQADVPEQRMKFGAAVTYGFNLGKGWRLPTHDELRTLVDETLRGPACSAFPDTPYGSDDDGYEAFWTLNEWWAPETGMRGWYVVDFGDGGTSYLSHTHEQPLRVRCVRDLTASHDPWPQWPKSTGVNR